MFIHALYAMLIVNMIQGNITKENNILECIKGSIALRQEIFSKNLRSKIKSVLNMYYHEATVQIIK